MGVVAGKIMTTNVVTVTPETPIQAVAELLATHRFGALPVVAADGTVVGMVTEEDMVQRAARIHLPRHLDFLGGIVYLENPQTFTVEAEKILAITAREIMDDTLHWVRPDTPVEEVAARLLDEDLRRLLVLSEHRHLLGIITRADIVRMMTATDQSPEGSE